MLAILLLATFPSLLLALLSILPEPNFSTSPNLPFSKPFLHHNLPLPLPYQTKSLNNINRPESTVDPSAYDPITIPASGGSLGAVPYFCFPQQPPSHIRARYDGNGASPVETDRGLKMVRRIMAKDLRDLREDMQNSQRQREAAKGKKRGSRGRGAWKGEMKKRRSFKGVRELG